MTNRMTKAEYASLKDNIYTLFAFDLTGKKVFKISYIGLGEVDQWTKDQQAQKRICFVVDHSLIDVNVLSHYIRESEIAKGNEKIITFDQIISIYTMLLNKEE